MFISPRRIATAVVAAVRVRPAAVTASRCMSTETYVWRDSDPLVGVMKDKPIPFSDDAVAKAMSAVRGGPYFSDPYRSQLIEAFRVKTELLLDGGLRRSLTSRSLYISGERGIGKSLLLRSIVLALGQTDSGLLPIYIDSKTCDKSVADTLRHAAEKVRGWRVPTEAKTAADIVHSLQSQGPNKQVKVVLVIDEAEELWKAAGAATHKNLRDVYALATNYDCHSFVVLAGSYALRGLLTHNAADASLEKMYPGVASGFDMNDSKILKYPLHLSSQWVDVSRRIIEIGSGPSFNSLASSLSRASSNEPETKDRVTGFINFMTGGNPRLINQFCKDGKLAALTSQTIRLRCCLPMCCSRKSPTPPFNEIPGLSTRRLVDVIKRDREFDKFRGAALHKLVIEGQFRYTDAGLVTAPTPFELAKWMHAHSIDLRPATFDSRVVDQVNGVLSVAEKALKIAAARLMTLT